VIVGDGLVTAVEGADRAARFLPGRVPFPATPAALRRTDAVRARALDA